MRYSVVVARAAQRDFRRLPREVRPRVRKVMTGLESDPRGPAQKLAGVDAYRVRVGDYRIVYRVDDDAREVLIARVRHRRDVYRNL